MSDHLPRLSRTSLDRVHGARSPVLLEGMEIGVVHLGPGAFFRAHQMPVYERCLRAAERGWGVCGVSLRSPGVRDALAPQDGLYTLFRLGGSGQPQVMEALRELLVAPEQPDAVLARLSAPATRVIAMTVTEKGYHLRPDGELDVEDPAVLQDLRAADRYTTIYGWLGRALRARREAGTPAPLMLSCDNNPGNGAKLRRALATYCRAAADLATADWIDAMLCCPDSMVDCITPATDDALRKRVEVELGVVDAWPIQREPFSQWVIARASHPALDQLAAAGVTLTSDVAMYERAKLRLLNGAHSTLAYLGLLQGIETVSEAMAAPRLASFVETLMRDDLLPTVRPTADLDGSRYIDAILDRFRNGAIRHRLAQIAIDGSQKLPIRLGGAAEDALARGSRLDRLAVPFAAWMRWIATLARAGRSPDDPLSSDLRRLGDQCRDDAAVDTALFLDGTAVAPSALRSSAAFRDALRDAYAALLYPDRALLT